jgi:hypothetical protein
MDFIPGRDNEEDSDGNGNGKDTGGGRDRKKGGEKHRVHLADPEVRSLVSTAHNAETASSRNDMSMTETSQEDLPVRKSSHRLSTIGGRNRGTEERKSGSRKGTDSFDQDSSRVSIDEDEGKHAERSQGRDSGKGSTKESRPSSRHSRKAAGAIAAAAKMAENSPNLGFSELISSV